MKKIMTIVLLAVVFLGSLSGAGLAASPWKEQTGYANQLKYKLDFGFRNTLLGWSEVITEPWEAHKENGSILESAGRGIWNAVADTIGGILHLATFPLTMVDLPLPENGV